MGVAFVAHCLLNQNSKVGDGAHCAGVYSPVIDVLREKGWRIEQMPCPELAFTGLNRFWAVKEQLDTAAYRRHCERLAEAVAAAISVRVGRGEEVVLVGVEGSPSMGVTITSSDPLRGGRPEWPDGTAEHISGEGIFVEEIRKALARRGIGFPRVAGETHALAGHDEATQRAGVESALEGLMKPDERSFRIMLVADRYVNPPPGGLDAVAVAAQTGWGVMQLPADDYPAEVAEPLLDEVAEQVEEFSRHGYGFVLVGERAGLAEALARAGVAVPDGISPGTPAQLAGFLDGQPAPRAGWSTGQAAG